MPRRNVLEDLEGLEGLGRLIALEARALKALPKEALEGEGPSLARLLEEARLLHLELYGLHARLAAPLEDNSAKALREEFF